MPVALGVPRLVGMAFELGELRKLDELVASGAEEQATVTRLQRLGVERFAQARGSVCDLARRSMQATLERGGVDPAEIDAVYFATDCAWDAPQTGDRREQMLRFREELYGTLESLGLVRAFPQGMGLAGCGNLLPAIEAASNFVRLNPDRSAMIAVVDRNPPESRRVRAGAAAFSDGAASCIVTGRDAPGLRVGRSVGRVSYALKDVSAHQDDLRFGVEAARMIERLCGELHAAAQTTPADYRWVVGNNIALPALRALMFRSGFEPKRLFTANVPRYGHAFSADPLINLTTLWDADALDPGDRALAIVHSVASWGLLELVADRRAA